MRNSSMRTGSNVYNDSTARLLGQSSLDTATLQVMFASESICLTDSQLDRESPTSLRNSLKMQSFKLKNRVSPKASIFNSSKHSRKQSHILTIDANQQMSGIRETESH